MSLIDRLRPQVREPRLPLRDDFWRRKHRKPQPPLSIVPNDEPMEATQSHYHAQTETIDELIAKMRDVHPETPVSMPADPKRNPLDEIAKLVRALTYGEMMDLCEKVWGAKPDGELTQATLPATLHRWSTDGR